MNTESHFTAVKIVLGAFSSIGISAVLRRADIWFPFTPTFTSEPGKWVGWQDFVRIALAGCFLIFLPGVYFTCVMAALSQTPPPLSLNLADPGKGDIWTLIVLMTQILPALGFYDLWQAIMKSFPSLYSDDARKKIQTHYKNAFTAGHGAVVAYGLGLVCIPLLLLIHLFWINR